eukprot:363324-Chlamydomonas_euryale.AAC.4
MSVWAAERSKAACRIGSVGDGSSARAWTGTMSGGIDAVSGWTYTVGGRIDAVGRLQRTAAEPNCKLSCSLLGGEGPGVCSQLYQTHGQLQLKLQFAGWRGCWRLQPIEPNSWRSAVEVAVGWVARVLAFAANRMSKVMAIHTHSMFVWQLDFKEGRIRSQYEVVSLGIRLWLSPDGAHSVHTVHLIQASIQSQVHDAAARANAAAERAGKAEAAHAAAAEAEEKLRGELAALQAACKEKEAERAETQACVQVCRGGVESLHGWTSIAAKLDLDRISCHGLDNIELFRCSNFSQCLLFEFSS